jgi:hypothetical protein
MSKKMKSKDVVPQAAPKTNSKAARSRGDLAGVAPIDHWDERDIHFDDRGRVIIRNVALGRRLQAALDSGPITVIIPPATPITPRPPPPVDTMCYCEKNILTRQSQQSITEGGAAGQAITGYA